jgi:hypothetical protein
MGGSSGTARKEPEDCCELVVFSDYVCEPLAGAISVCCELVN